MTPPKREAPGNLLRPLAASRLPGDYNADGVVDAADYTVWRDGGSPDSTIEGYNVWVANFGASAAASGSAVPEPTAMGLVVLASAWLKGRRRSTR